MGDDRHLLEGPFGIFRFVIKSVFVFIAVLAALHNLANYADRLRVWEDAVRHNPYALPLLFALFLALHLIYEVVLREMRLRLERKRSNPMEPRRRKAAQAKGGTTPRRRR